MEHSHSGQGYPGLVSSGYGSSGSLWTEKYKPKKLKEIVGQLESRGKIINFIENFSAQKKKAILIYGPSGTGKTSLVYALAHDFNYEIIELNASDFRNKYQIKDVIGNAMKQQSFFKKGKIMLIDEVDGITGTKDRGSIQELLRIIEKTSYPIIFVANDPWKAKLRPLRSKTRFIELKPLNEDEIIFLLKRISKKEKLKISADTLKAISVMSKGDARAAITDLQVLSFKNIKGKGNKEKESKEINEEINEEIKEIKKEIEITKKEAASLAGFSNREKDESIFNALRLIFKSKSALNAFDNVQNTNSDDLFLWIDENLPLEYKGKDLARAYDVLSKADIFRGRIRRWQHWHFLSYIMILLTDGIATSKKDAKQDFTSYKPPSRILKIWMNNQKQAKRKVLIKKISKTTHTSVKKTFKEMPFLESFLEIRNFL